MRRKSTARKIPGKSCKEGTYGGKVCDEGLDAQDEEDRGAGERRENRLRGGGRLRWRWVRTWMAPIIFGDGGEDIVRQNCERNQMTATSRPFESIFRKKILEI